MIVVDAQTIERYSSRGWWGEATLDQQFRKNVAGNPGRMALVDAPNREALTFGAPRRLTYAQLDRAVDAFAARLLQLGVGKDDIVASQLPNIAESIVLLLACARLGAIVSPLLVQFDLNELRHTLSRLRPKVFLTVSGFKRRNLAQTAELACKEYACQLAVLDRDLKDGRDWLSATPADELQVREHCRTVGIDANDIFTVCWTSGTEGQPKGAMRSHNNWFWTGRSMLHGAALQPGDVILNTRPLVNMAAIGGSFMSWLTCAGTLVLHHPLDMALALRQIREERVQATFMPPAFFISLLTDAALMEQADLSSLRVMGTGSTAIPAWAIERMEREFGVEIVNFFGSNEGMSLLSSSRDIPEPQHRASYFPRFGCAGFEWPAFPLAAEIRSRLVDLASGADIDEPGRPGELRMSSPSIFAGYFGDAQRTRAAFDEQGFLRTGDLFEIAGEGELRRYYRFVGRCKDIIVRGGLKIAPAELDELLSRHPLLKEAAVFGYPDERLGEKVGVAAVPLSGQSPTLQDILMFLREQHVAIYKLPEQLIIVDQLPRNAMQKVLRTALRGLASAESAS